MQYREAERQRMQADQEERKDIARRVLSNPKSDESSITWARSILGQNHS